MTKRLFRAMFAVALAVLLCSVLCVMGAVNAYFTRVQAQQLQVEIALAAQASGRSGRLSGGGGFFPGAGRYAGLPDHLDFPGGKGAL